MTCLAKDLALNSMLHPRYLHLHHSKLFDCVKFLNHHVSHCILHTL